MNKLVTIIDPDYRFARMMAGRLRIHLPDLTIDTCSNPFLKSAKSEQNKAKPQADIIMYDNENITREQLVALHEYLPEEHFIPIREFDTKTRISASKASHHIQALLHDNAKPTIPSELNCTQNGKLIYVVSFCDIKKREQYIQKITQKLPHNAHPVYRIDLMPGIKSPTSTLKHTHKYSQLNSSAINKFLCSPEILENDQLDIMSYCYPDANGHYCLGRPLRSDDIIQSPINDLEKLLTHLRKRVERTESNTCAMAVIDELPFNKLEKICPIAHEIHILLSDEQQYNDPLFHFELNQLLSSLSPFQKYVILSGERNIL